MTSSKRLKKSTLAEDERKRRRHSVPKSSPKIKTTSLCRTPSRSADLLASLTPPARSCTPENKSGSQSIVGSSGFSVRRQSIATPNAPTRKRASARSPDWLRIIMTTVSAQTPLDLSNKESREESESTTGLDELVYVEWPQWNSTTWELLQSECSWMHLFLIAARYASLVVIEEIMNKLSTSRLNHLINEYEQNALVALCSQPPADVLVFEPRQYRPAALRVLDNNSTAEIDLGGAKSTTVLDSFMQAAERRQEEMGIIAVLLLKAKIDPSKPDKFGLSALDYAQRYTHHSILNEFDRKINSQSLTNNQLPIQQDSEIDVSSETAQNLPEDSLAEQRTPSVKPLEDDEVTTPISSPIYEEQYDASYLFGETPSLVSIHRNCKAAPMSIGGDAANSLSLFNDGYSMKGFCRASTTLDTEIGTGVETPRGLSPGGEMEEDPVVIQSCASNLPTACELTSQKRRGKRLQYASNKNLYAGLSDLHDLIASDAEKRAAC